MKLFPDAVDEARFRSELERPAAAIRYCILFTPRSGSSWLTDVARQTGRLGQPGEHFNPTYVPAMASRFNARTLDDFVQVLLRRKNVGGTFGVEATYFQLKTVFGSERAFLKLLGDVPFFWLIREDVVLQAISLMKKQQTRIAHHTQASAATRAEAERLFVYDEGAIRHWLRHLRAMERKTEAMIARHRLAVHRMSYERNVARGALEVVREIARAVGAGAIPPMEFAEAHQKIATPLNAEMAGRFRAANPGFVARLEDERAPMLAALSTPA